MRTLGGGARGRVMGILGWRSAKDGLVLRKRMSRMERAGCDRFAGGAAGTGTVGEGLGGGMVAVLGTQFVKRSRSFAIAVSCSWWMVAGASFTAHERKFKAWTMRSPSVTVGWVR